MHQRSSFIVGLGQGCIVEYTRHTWWFVRNRCLWCCVPVLKSLGKASKFRFQIDVQFIHKSSCWLIEPCHRIILRMLQFWNSRFLTQPLNCVSCMFACAQVLVVHYEFVIFPETLLFPAHQCWDSRRTAPARLSAFNNMYVPLNTSACWPRTSADYLKRYTTVKIHSRRRCCCYVIDHVMFRSLMAVYVWGWWVMQYGPLLSELRRLSYCCFYQSTWTTTWRLGMQSILMLKQNLSWWSREV